MHIVILGAGISGLSLGWYLKKFSKRSIQLTLVEQSDRVGGNIQTRIENDFLFECGPHTLRTKHSEHLLELVEDLQLTNDLIFSDDTANIRYLYLNKMLNSLPTGFFSSLTNPLVRPHLKTFIKEFFKPKSSNTDITIEEFAKSRWSKEVADLFFDPLTTGIFAGDYRKLSFPSCFPKLFQWEQHYGSVLKGLLKQKKNKNFSQSSFVKESQKFTLFSFKNGMETLPSTIAQKLDAEIILGEKVIKLSHKDNMQITLSSGKNIKSDSVISTLPASSLSPILEQELPHVALPLKNIPTNTVTLVHLGYKHSVLPKTGFGYLIPRSEKQKILGVIFSSCVFPQQNSHANQTRLTVMVSTGDKDHAVNVTLKQIAEHLNIDISPDVIHTCIAKDAIPQYVLGHLKTIDQAKEALKNSCWPLSFIGKSYQGVSVSDCVSNAILEAKKICLATD